MANIIIPYRRYCSNTATLNRLLGYAKGLSIVGNHVTMIFLITQSDYKEHNEIIQDVEFVYLWKENNRLIRNCKLLSYIINLFKLAKLVNNNIVFLYSPSVHLLLLFSLYRKHKIICEFTEHVFAYRSKTILRLLIEKIRIILLKNVLGIAVISKNLKQYYIRQGISEEKIIISNMFVDTTRFNNVVKEPSDNPYFAYCGTISTYKDGVDDLIKAFGIFHRTNIKYSLYIIGNFQSSEIKKELLELAQKCQVAESIVFTGKIQSDAIPQILSNADVLLLDRPQNIQADNGFPTKLGEYLATGNPVLVTDVGDIGLFIKDGINGYVAEPNNIESFSSKLEYIITHYEEAKRVGQLGKQLVYHDFSFITQSEKLTRFFK